MVLGGSSSRLRVPLLLFAAVAMLLIGAGGIVGGVVAESADVNESPGGVSIDVADNATGTVELLVRFDSHNDAAATEDPMAALQETAANSSTAVHSYAAAHGDVRVLREFWIVGIRRHPQRDRRPHQRQRHGPVTLRIPGPALTPRYGCRASRPLQPDRAGCGCRRHR